MIGHGGNQSGPKDPLPKHLLAGLRAAGLKMPAVLTDFGEPVMQKFPRTPAQAKKYWGVTLAALWRDLRVTTGSGNGGKALVDTRHRGRKSGDVDFLIGKIWMGR